MRHCTSLYSPLQAQLPQTSDIGPLLGSGPRPHANDIWWSSLDAYSNLFTRGPTLSAIVHSVADAESSAVGQRVVCVLLECFLVTARVAKRAKVMFSQAFVCPSPRGGGRWHTKCNMGPGQNIYPPPPGPGQNVYPLPPRTRSECLPPAPPGPGQNVYPLPPGPGQNVYLLPPGTRSECLPPPPGTRSECLPPPPGTRSECLPPVPPRPGQNVYSLPPQDQVRMSTPSPLQPETWSPPPNYTQAGGTHPTGMHSCLLAGTPSHVKFLAQAHWLAQPFPLSGKSWIRHW